MLPNGDHRKIQQFLTQGNPTIDRIIMDFRIDPDHNIPINVQMFHK